jgi:hypothetical protein
MRKHRGKLKQRGKLQLKCVNLRRCTDRDKIYNKVTQAKWSRTVDSAGNEVFEYICPEHLRRDVLELKDKVDWMMYYETELPPGSRRNNIGPPFIDAVLLATIQPIMPTNGSIFEIQILCSKARLGKKLLDEAMVLAKQQKCEAVGVNLPPNVTTRKYFRNQGFRSVRTACRPDDDPVNQEPRRVGAPQSRSQWFSKCVDGNSLPKRGRRRKNPPSETSNDYNSN